MMTSSDTRTVGTAGNPVSTSVRLSATASSEGGTRCRGQSKVCLPDTAFLPVLPVDVGANKFVSFYKTD